MKPGTAQAARIALVTLVAAVAGALIGGILWQNDPVVGALFFPFTLVGALLVLLPTYWLAREARGWSRIASYAAVLLAGILGSYLILALFVALVGGVTAGPLPLSIVLAGASFGGGTAIAWVAAYHLTRERGKAD